MAQLNKKYGRSVITNASNAKGMGFRRWDTGIMGINLLCGGDGENWGIPGGRITELWGDKGSGKTTISLNVVKSVQKEGFCGAFVTTEGAWDDTWAQFVGVDLDKMIIARADSAELTIDLVNSLIKTPGIGCVIIDSVAMITPQAELDVDLSKDKIQPGGQARAVNLLMRIISSSLNSWPIDDVETLQQQPAVILLNQVRQTIGIAYGDPNYSPGGKGKDFQASIQIQTAVGPKIKMKIGSEESVVGLTLKAKCTKNKTWPPYKVAEYVLYTMNVEAEDGRHEVSKIDEVDEAMRWGAYYGLVEKRGPMYKFGEVDAKGQNEFRRIIRENTELFEELRTGIYAEALERRG